MIRTVAVWLILCTIWSSTWLFIKVGLLDLPPLFFAGTRFLVAFGALAALAWAQRLPWPARRDWPLIAGTGLLTFGVNYGLIFWGEQHFSTGLAAILQATIPAFGMVFAHVYLPRERITSRKAAGVLLGLLGVGVIFSTNLHVRDPSAAVGCLAIVVGALSVAYANVLIKARGGHLTPITLAAGQMLWGFASLFAASLLLERGGPPIHWTPRVVWCVLYLALAGSALAFVLLYWLLRNTEATRVLMISLITPVAAVGLGILFLGETLTRRASAGAACVLLGVALVLVPFRRVLPVRAESASAP